MFDKKPFFQKESFTKEIIYIIYNKKNRGDVIEILKGLHACIKGIRDD
jgi:hypothetical protein